MQRFKHFSIAAAYLYKQNQSNLSCSDHEAHFDLGVVLNPMFEKRYKRGEDSYVAHPRFICVCDGVGGWIRKLVDVGLFSKEFTRHINELYVKKQYSSLKDLLDSASKMTKAKGSSTCVMAELTDSKTLSTCNLGDSGYMLFRPQPDGTTHFMFKSETQQHRFNAPYQTGTDKTWPTRAKSLSHEI